MQTLLALTQPKKRRGMFKISVFRLRKRGVQDTSMASLCLRWDVLFSAEF